MPACRAGRATRAGGPVAIFGIPPGSPRPRGHCGDAPPSHLPTQHRPLDLARSASTSPPYPPGQRSGGHHRPERGPSRSIPVRPIPATLPDEVYIAERKETTSINAQLPVPRHQLNWCSTPRSCNAFGGNQATSACTSSVGVSGINTISVHGGKLRQWCKSPLRCSSLYHSGNWLNFRSRVIQVDAISKEKTD